jgi:hypothetical protein
LFTTQTLGLNPEILENTKLRAIKWSIWYFQIKKCNLFFSTVVVELIRWRLIWSQAFQEFSQCNRFVEEILMQQFMQPTPKGEKAIVSILELVLIVVILMVKNYIKSTITRLHCDGWRGNVFEKNSYRNI